MKRKQALIILIPSFIFVILWIIFNIYHGIVTSTISQSLDVQIAPISPNFDTKTIQILKQRAQVAPIYQTTATNTLPSQIPTPTVSSKSAVVASPGGSLSQ